jgi:hypothetical protein
MRLDGLLRKRNVGAVHRVLRYIKAEAEGGYSSATPPPSRAASSASSRLT